MRVLFAGTPDFAAAHLQALLDAPTISVIGVYSQPDRPAGRGKKLTASPVKKLALKHQLPVFQPQSLKDPQQQRILSELQADIMVVVAYGLILPQAILDAPRLGCINVHASILPRWRGAAPIQRAIEAGDAETGVTIMQMDAGLDTGAMLSVSRCDIDSNETSASLHSKLEVLGAPALLHTLESLNSGLAVAVEQDDQLSCYAAKITKQEALIDWSQSAQILDRQIRAFNPFPAAYTTLDELRIKIWQAEPTTASGLTPGQIISADSAGILVSCGEQSLLLTEIQLPGKSRMAVSEVLKSRGELFAPKRLLGS
ncbi:methionyl-tRNA formyltransferase [Porticoccaceae bacterium]|nr:methionyl-tRNA formyltransferase [Porticoccaceae bacterium]MDB9736743.1 methionyl-tRNA formyltransferase [Porticoccaceae bacterium]MDB9804540.1 methionyl-tRNA formyltransferase [Porticoccaceae bacterium]MDB9969930.1 methionyl-tRNA formyltransferase [Porticoccaceae bacterium]